MAMDNEIKVFFSSDSGQNEAGSNMPDTIVEFHYLDSGAYIDSTVLVGKGRKFDVHATGDTWQG